MAPAQDKFWLMAPAQNHVCHQSGTIHIHDVKELYLKHWKGNNWDEGDECNLEEFLNLEWKIYLKMFPHNKVYF